MHIGQFTRQYPAETAFKVQSNPWKNSPEPFLPMSTQQPKSWADVGKVAGPPRNYHHPYEVKPFEAIDEKNDVFSTMGHWNSEQKQSRQQHQQYQQNQYQARQHQYYQNPPPFYQPEQPVHYQSAQQDVFDNIGEWDNSTPIPSQISPLQLDLTLTTPLPTFQPYPSTRSYSLESPTTSVTSNEEKNSWKTIELILNQKSSRSPSITERLSPVDFGPWTSNL
eukprot:NP_491283.1 Uncharacterized protein CELE_F28H1.1 [Caenorhabditis elegans]